MNKKISALVITSLALNLFLIGFIVGHKSPNYGFPPSKHDPKDHFARKEQMLLEALSDDNQERGKEVFSKLRQIRENNLKQSKANIDQLKAVISSDNFNQTEFLEAMSLVDQSMINTKQESDQVVAEFLSSISKDERIKLVKKFEEFGPDKFNKDQPKKDPEHENFHSQPEPNPEDHGQPQPPMPPLNKPQK